MTTKRVTPSPEAGNITQFPDVPLEEVTGYHSINFPGYPGSLSLHFGNLESTVILSEVAAALIPTEAYEGVRYPDLLIAFNVRPEAILPRNGYLIPEQGKPPDFVLEVASASTARRDETTKRDDYARMGVLEYWRFDATGGRFHSVPLAGDRLADAAYRPVEIHRTDDAHLWGHSEALNLDLCWEEGRLRFRDPADGRYLTTFAEEREAYIAEREAHLAERDGRLRNAMAAWRNAMAAWRNAMAAWRNAMAAWRNAMAAWRNAMLTWQSGKPAWRSGKPASRSGKPAYKPRPVPMPRQIASANSKRNCAASGASSRAKLHSAAVDAPLRHS